MQTEQVTSAPIFEYPPQDQINDEVWKRRDEAVWGKYVQPFITNNTAVLDAGGGVGRLLPRLWHAQRITLAEPDPTFYLRAAALGDCLNRGDQTMVNELLTTSFNYAVADKTKAIVKAARPNDKFQALNVTMFDPVIGDHGPFDLIICSHVVEHTPFSIMQEALAAFSTFLKPTGMLIIYCSKSPVLHHLCSKLEPDKFSNEFITREEFAQRAQTIQSIGYLGTLANRVGLPVRYFPYDLLETILTDPFAPALQTIFQEEYQAQPIHTQFVNPVSFSVRQWGAYHTHFYANSMPMIRGVFPEYLQLQGMLGLPLKAIESVDEASALEEMVNQDEVLKRLFLTDMVVVAQKVI